MIENKTCPRCSSWFAVEQVDGDFSGICPRCLAGLLDGGPESPLTPGAAFGGFEILDVLGQGGMGVVYKARQTSLNRIVALKVLAPQTSGSKEFALRFDREAKVLATLNHPNVVQVHDFGREAEVPYLVMEYVDGESLETALKRGPMPAARFLDILRDVARGLRKVHEAGLIHRDLKPANIFLTRDGSAKIGDFGLAVRTEADCHVTEHGYFVGTPHYASPEHAQGAAVDARSDLYALGAILYEGFAGRPPFQAPSPAMVLAKHIEEPAPALDGPKDVATLVRRLLEKDPAKRFATAAELEAALEKVSLAPAPRRRPWAWAAAALLLAVGSLFLLRPAPAGLSFLLKADEALRADDFEGAAKAVEKARRDPSFEAQAVALNMRLSALRAAKQEEDLGHYYCFSKGEWEKGLPLIAAGEDSPYREAARRDLEGKTPAEAWLELAKAAKPRWAERMRERAWAWLDAAGNPRAAELDATLEARREIDLLRLSPQLRQGRLRAAELQSLPYLPPAAYDLEIEAEGELLVWLPGAGGRRVATGMLRVRDGRASVGTPADLRVAEPRLFHVQGLLTKLALRAVLPAPRAEVDDLVRRVDVKRDAVVGAWTVDGGALVSPVADYARIQIPVDLPEEYDFEARVERRQGSAVGIGLVSGGRPFAVMVDSHYATLSGIDMIDGRRVQENEATWRGKALEDFKPAHVRVEVRCEGVRLLVDGRALVDWKGARERLSLPRDWATPNPRRPWVSAWSSVVRFSRISVTPAADLIARMDVKRDAVVGAWTIEGGAVVSPMGEFVRLQLPVELPDEYDLEMDVERRQGAAISVGLVSGGRPFMVTLDSHGGTMSGLDHVDGRRLTDNETLWKGRVFENLKPSRVRIEVRRDGVRVTIDQRTIIDWKGNRERLSNTADWAVPNPRAPWLSAWQSIVRFSRITVTPVSGVVDLLSRIDPKQHAVSGTWLKQDGALVSSAADFFSRVQIPAEVPAEYDLLASVERLEGMQDFFLGLRQGRHRFGVMLNAGDSSYCAIQGKVGDLVRVERGVFEKGRLHEVLCKVRDGSVEVLVDGARVLAYRGDLSYGSMFPQWAIPDPKALFLGSHGSLHRVRRLVLTPVRSTSLAPLEANRLDLVALVDPARDAVAGRWVRSGKGILGMTTDAFPRVLFPVKAPAEYDLTLDVERKEGFRSLIVGLVSGESEFVAHIDGWTGTVSGLDLLDDKGADQNETTRRDLSFLPLDRRVQVVVAVRRSGVRVAVDGRTIIDWSGDARRLSMNKRNRPMPRPGLSVGAWDSRFLIHAATLVEIK